MSSLPGQEDMRHSPLSSAVSLHKATDGYLTFGHVCSLSPRHAMIKDAPSDEMIQNVRGQTDLSDVSFFGMCVGRYRMGMFPYQRMTIICVCGSLRVLYIFAAFCINSGTSHPLMANRWD